MATEVPKASIISAKASRPTVRRQSSSHQAAHCLEHCKLALKTGPLPQAHNGMVPQLE